MTFLFCLATEDYLKKKKIIEPNILSVLKPFEKKGAYSTMNSTVCLRTIVDTQSWNEYMHLVLEDSCILWSILKD